MKPRAIDIVQPKYHPSAKPPTAPGTLNKEDVLLLLEKGKRSQTTLPDGSTAPRPTAPPSRRPSSAAPRRLLWLSSAGAVLIIAVFFGLQAGSRVFDQWADLTPLEVVADEVVPEPTPEEAAVSTSSVTPASGETASANPFTGTVTEQVAPPPVEAPPPAAVPLKVRVLNGNGRTGSAQQAAAVLQKAGIEVVSSGNAKTYSYARTIVYYPAGKKEAAEQVAAALTGYSTSVQEHAVANGYDSLVVIGAQ